MDDLLDLSWDQKSTPAVGGVSGKIKPPPPPPTTKPVHLQMGLSKTGVSSTPASSAPFSAPSAPKKNADDIFGSLIPSFGQTSDVSKSLNAMTLEERRRYDQQQSLSSLNSSSTLAGFAPGRPTPSYSFSQPAKPTPSPLNSGMSTPRGYDPGNIAGFSKPIPTSSSQSTSGVASPIPKAHQPQPFQQQQHGSLNNPQRHQSSTGWTTSPGGLGRTLSPAMIPLQPERSTSPSPAATASSMDPFDSLLGDQISRGSPSLKNQTLNSIRLNTPPLGQTASLASGGADPWDLDFLANATVSKSSQPASTKISDVFDLGAFEKAPPGKPVRQRDPMDALDSFVGNQQPISGAASLSRTSSTTSKTEPIAKPRPPASPPISSKEDGDIAQIVSMGFSAERAKLALSMTEGGRNIEAAIEYLLQNDEAEDRMSSRQRSANAYRDDDDLPSENYRRRNQSQSHGRSGQRPSQQELTRAQQLHQQKDKFLGTASVFGMSVLSKANEIYKQGREKVQAVMDDMSTEEPRSNATRRRDWMDDEAKPGRYKDSDSEEDEVYRGRRDHQREQEQRQKELQGRQQQQQTQTSRVRQEKETFEDTYVSSSRRGGASVSKGQKSLFSMGESSPNSKFNTLPSSSKSSSNLAASPTFRQAARTPSPHPPKPARPPRVLVQADSQQLAESSHFKEKGNQAFKLGQFGQAAELYARAGQALPSGHTLLIVTQNNRAAALLKVGEYRETITECDRSILLVQGPDGQGVNDVLPADIGVNLKDQLGKALMRRAMAHENLEKYKEARDDWAKLRELEPGHRNAAEGHRRCEKALAVMNGAGDKSSSSTSAKRPGPPPSSSVQSSAARSNGSGSNSSPMQDIMAAHRQSNSEAKLKADLNRSEGVSKLRQTAAQQEREDDERLRLTDQVDRKMVTWKSGKEDNIRALLASLGSVLWEGAAWKPVGMHELVTPSQVKINYMKAIAKMHPDKLSSSTTVEQRMMANTIFSTLNSAWDAFKTQNNM
ncbi:MAG: hypothetical protein J3Q66DRAFT_353057 [Benniella sp.]|nr:MAG: hypothetical protein J3Q66DRAFT_353057 [Benniella sp.]